MDLSYILAAARRRWWILLLVPIICGALAFYWSENQPRLYSASATIRINPPALSTDVSAIQLVQDLTETYRQLILMPPVLERVTSELDLPYDARELAKKVTATTIRDTQLVQIHVSDEDPAKAAEIANSLATNFTTYIAQESQAQIDATLAGLDDEIAGLTTQISDIDGQIAELEAADEPDASTTQQVERLQTERNRLQDQVVELESQGQAASLATAAAQTQVTISAPATAPVDPYAPRVMFVTILGVFIGFLIAVGLAALAEYLDNTVKDANDVQRLLGVPVLASIPIERGITRHEDDELFVLAKPSSGAAEAFRLLRANLVFAMAGRDVKSLAVSSAQPGDGKSTVSANVSAVLAQAGLRTTLVDGDLRRPTLGQVFGISNQTGLTTLLTHPERTWQSISTQVATPLLTFIPSGSIPPNPTDLLSIERFAEVLDEIESAADLVVIDSPPVLAIADPLVIAKRADAVLLVAKAGKTRRDDLRKAFEAFASNQIHVLGVVLNQQPQRSINYYYSYGETQPQGKKRGGRISGGNPFRKKA